MCSDNPSCPDCGIPEMSLYEQQKYESRCRACGPFEPRLLGNCAHCEERVWDHDDPGECSHGVAHGECMAANGCETA